MPFWISPRLHPDFGWAWLTRFLVNLGNALGLLYLLYFLQDVIGYSSEEAENRVFVLTAVYALTLVLTTVVFGAWSDRLGRRKVFVIWSGLVSGSAAVLLGVGQSWPAALAAAVVMGCAYGIYTAVDFALITEVLPTAIDRAKDLGVINVANALPQVFAPVLAGLLLWLVEAAGGVVESDGHGLLDRLLRPLPARVPLQRAGLGVRHPDPRRRLTAEECRSAGPGSGWT